MIKESIISTKCHPLSFFYGQCLQQLICSMLVLQGIGNQDSEVADKAEE